MYSCLIYNNLEEGIDNYDSNCDISDCIIYDNETGIKSEFATTNITNCVIYDNDTGISGPGSSLNISGCLIYDNEIYGLQINNETFVNKTTFTQNDVAIIFPSIPWPPYPSFEIINSILWDNRTTFVNYNGNYVTVSYSDLPE